MEPIPSRCQPSPNRPSLAQSVAGAPTATMAIQYTRYMTTAKMGRPSQRFVTILSILSEAES